MGAIASQITSFTMIVYSTVYSGTDQRKHQSSASLAFVLGMHRGPVNSPHKWPVMRKMFPFDGVIMVMKMHGIRHSYVNASSKFGYTYIYGVSNTSMLIVHMKSNFVSAGNFYLSHGDNFIYVEIKCFPFPSSQPDSISFQTDSKLIPSHWETSLQDNAVSHWLGANLESALKW